MGKKSKPTASSTIYGNTTTTNPYAYATTNNGGTISGFQNGTALQEVYNFVNRNMGSLLEDYLTPNLNSATNRAKINEFTKTLNNQMRYNLENNIINPLSQRNMVRSSQASDLYKNLSNQANASVENYISNLLIQAQENSAKMLNNLMKLYLSGYDVISDMQEQSLNTSKGNALTTKGSGSNSSDAIKQAASAIAQVFSSME